MRALNEAQIEALLAAIRLGLKGDAIEKIVITIKPKPKPKQ